jgi:hypothetical protein
MLDTTTITVKDAGGNLIPFTVAEVGSARLEIMLLADGETGALISPATETTLAEVVTALADAASATKQDAATAVLDAISAALAGKLSVKQEGIAPPLGYEQLSISTAAGLGTIPSGAVTAVVVPRGPVRWRDDGTSPTAAAGMYLPADTPLIYQGSLAALELIAVTGTVEVNVSFYGVEA